MGLAATMLGQAYLQKARETGDPGYYPKAETLFHQALDRRSATTSRRWSGSARWPSPATNLPRLSTGASRRARLNPHHAAAYGVIGDAQIELGRYDEAVETVQPMVDLRPDLGSYSRVSYVRELMGDRDGRAGRDGASGDGRIRLRRKCRLGPASSSATSASTAAISPAPATTTPRRWRPCPATPRHWPDRRE